MRQPWQRRSWCVACRRARGIGRGSGRWAAGPPTRTFAWPRRDPDVLVSGFLLSSPLAGDASGVHKRVQRRALQSHILADFDDTDAALGDESVDKSLTDAEVVAG